MMKMCSVRLFFNSVGYNLRRHYSALYITGDKASQNFAVLIPHIDFEDRIRDKDELVQNVTARGLPIDIDKVEKSWNFFKFMSERRHKLQETRIEIGHEISNVIKNSAADNEEIDKLKLHLKIVKDDLKGMKESYYEVEEGTMLKILSLPNILHKRTPLESEEICHIFSERVNAASRSHMDLGKEANLIEYIDPFTCFFKSDAALFEQCSLNYARTFLLKSGYVQFSNSNFCRTVIAEGCDDNVHEYAKLLTLEEPDHSAYLNKLHLCGSSTLFSFMAYFARHSVQASYFPLTYFSVGKSYKNATKGNVDSLFNLGQESTVNVFVATLEGENVLDSLVSQITKLYEGFGYHFRLVLLPASKLEKAESLRLSVQMFSNFFQEYVEVANISAYDNFISKRLLFSYSVNKQRKFPVVYSGTLLNVPKLLGCVLENNSVNNEKLLSDILRKYMFQ